MSAPLIFALGGVYGLPALVGIRLVAGHLAWRISDSYRQDRPDGFDWLAGFLGAVLVVSVWPLALAFHFIGRRFALGAERDARLRQAQRRVRDLERELGVDS